MMLIGDEPQSYPSYRDIALTTYIRVLEGIHNYTPMPSSLCKNNDHHIVRD